MSNNKPKPRNKARAADQTTMTVSMPDELKRRIKAAAASEKRAASNWMVKMLTEFLEEKEKLSKKPPRG